jgi:hypothetical protein
VAKDKQPKDKPKSKTKAGGKGKGKGATDTGADGGPGLSLAEHPRAARRVAEAKSWGALGGFLLGGYLSLSSHSLFETGLRALVAGAVCYVAVWALAVFLWRRLIVAELRHAEHELLAQRIARLQGAGAVGEPAGASGTPGPSGSTGL